MAVLGGGAQGCGGGDGSSGAGPGVDSGGADQTTTQPPADGSSAADTGAGDDTGANADGSARPGVCGFATEAGNAFECDDATMCSGAAPVCCLKGGVQSDPVCGRLYGTKVTESACRAACGTGEIALCTTDAQCAGVPGTGCVAFSSKGHTFGLCTTAGGGGGGDGGGDGGSDAGSNCGPPPTLHPTDGGVGPYCPFSDAGRCALGATCCHANNTDPEYCR